MSVEVWNPVDCCSASSVNLSESLGRMTVQSTQCEIGCLWKTERSTEFCKEWSVPWRIGVYVLDGGDDHVATSLSRFRKLQKALSLSDS